MAANQTALKRSSRVLADIAAQSQQKRHITYEAIIHHLGKKAFGIGMILFALPSALPLSAIPGVSFVFSLPIAFFALQIAFMAKEMWLPKRLASYTVETEKLTTFINKSLPYIKRLEYWIKPRLGYMLGRLITPIHGMVIFVLVVLLMLPIPLSNFIFSGIIILFGLGFSEGDGVLVIAAYVAIALYVAAIVSVIFGLMSIFG